MPPCAARKLASGEALALGTDARSLALGEASLAMSRGEVGSLPQSPLGLAGLEKGAFALSHGFLVESLSLNHFAYGRKGQRVNWGLSVLMLDYGLLDRRDAAGNSLGGFTPSDRVVQLSLAKGGEEWEGGVSLKRLESKILDKAGAWAADAAVRRPLNDDLTAAVAARNFGQKMKFDQEAFDLPSSFAAGLSWKAAEALLWNLEANLPLHSDVWVAVGGQYRHAAREGLALVVRVGANTRNPELGGLAGFHAGFGVEWSRIMLDYSYDPFGDIGTSHRLSLGYRW